MQLSSLSDIKLIANYINSILPNHFCLRKCKKAAIYSQADTLFIVIWETSVNKYVQLIERLCSNNEKSVFLLTSREVESLLSGENLTDDTRHSMPVNITSNVQLHDSLYKYKWVPIKKRKYARYYNERTAGISSPWYTSVDNVSNNVNGGRVRRLKTCIKGKLYEHYHFEKTIK